MCDNKCDCIGVEGIESQAAFDYANLMSAAVVFYGRNFEFDCLDDRMDAVASALEEIIESDLDAELIYEANVVLQENGFKVIVTMDEGSEVGFEMLVTFSGDDDQVAIDMKPLGVSEETSDIEDLPFDPDEPCTESGDDPDEKLN